MKVLMFAALTVLLTVHGLAQGVGAAPKDPGAGMPLKILNGDARLIVVNGYSTSFQWPTVLQAKLDRFFGGKSPVEVVRATRGGSPIARWMNVETGRPTPIWDTLTKALESRGDRPAIVLAQQSLQRAFGDRRAGIDGPGDEADIRRGADTVRRYVDLLHGSGADFVFVAMHIYKHPMEPQIGNERLALSAYASTRPGRFSPGPDVWEPTRPLYPWGFAKDKLHPGDGAIAVMAHLWFETLCRHDGIETPTWSRLDMERAVQTAREAYEQKTVRVRPGRDE